MAFALIASVNAGGDSSTCTTGSIDTTGANLIVVYVAGYEPGGGITLTDSKSNSWTALTKSDAAGGINGQLYYCYNGTVGSGHTFTGTNSYPNLSVMAFSGAATSPYSAESGASGSAGTIQPGNITPAEDNMLLVCGCSQGSTITGMTIDGGFTEASADAAGSAFRVAGAYLIQTTAAAANPTWTINSGGYGNVARMATFKAAAGGGGGVFTPYYYTLLSGGVAI